MATSTAVSKIKAANKSLIQGEDLAEAIKKAAPKHLSSERFIRIAATAMNRVPKLRECSPSSIWQCLLDLSATGLEPDNRRAHLIPYWDSKTKSHRAQLIIDYKGYVELAMRSGKVSSIHADIVCENDTFEYDMGELKKHKIDFRKPRGEMYAAYALIRFTDPKRIAKCEVMTKDEIDGIRKRSKAGQSGPWVTDYNEMAKKTAFRRATKWLEMNPEIQAAIEKDEDTVIPEAMVTVEPTNLETPGVSMFEGPPELEEPEAPAEKAPKKTRKKAEPAPPPTEEEEITPVATLRELCKDSEIQVGDLCGYLRKQGLLSDDEMLEDLEDARAAIIISGWDTVAKTLGGDTINV